MAAPWVPPTICPINEPNVVLENYPDPHADSDTANYDLVPVWNSGSNKINGITFMYIGGKDDDTLVLVEKWKKRRQS